MLAKIIRSTGKVRYCRFVTLGYDVGIAFDERRNWNRKRFALKHLLEIPAGNCGGE